MQRFVKYYKLDRWREGGRASPELGQFCRSSAAHSQLLWTRTAKGGTGRGSELRIWVPAASALLWAFSALCVGIRDFGTTKPSLDGNLKPLCCGAELP